MNPGAVTYSVGLEQAHRHIYEICIELASPQAQQCFRLPVWIPGSYLVREFSKHVCSVRAEQGGSSRPVKLVRKDTWEVSAQPGLALRLHYEVVAHDDSVRTAWLDTQRGFFNGTSLFMQALDQPDGPFDIHLQAPSALSNWRLATAMPAVKTKRNGFGHYRVAHYDELVDHPVEMGSFWEGHFVLRGVAHRLVVSGAGPRFDGQRLLADTQTICATAMQFWHGKGKPPFDRYVFLLNTMPQGYGGLEHRNSTALLAKHSDLPRLHESQQTEGYFNLLGLISHEYFHTWNVKRLKPADFSPHRLDTENLTELLWFFEGFTSYYDDLLLRRAGLITRAQYLARLQTTLQQVELTPGRFKHSLAQASLEAWTKFYRPDAHTPNLTVSYYAKGALLALCWDLTLRAQGHSLDQVMRHLWQQCHASAMTEADWLAALAAVRGSSCLALHQAWVHGQRDLPVYDLLTEVGITTQTQPLTWPQRLGLRLKANSMEIEQVRTDTWAAKAGFAPGDEWVAVSHNQQTAWRLHSLEDLGIYAPPKARLTAWVFRQRAMLKLKLPALDSAPSHARRLQLDNPTLSENWLGQD